MLLDAVSPQARCDIITVQEAYFFFLQNLY